MKTELRFHCESPYGGRATINAESEDALLDSCGNNISSYQLDIPSTIKTIQRLEAEIAALKAKIAAQK